MPLVVVPIEIEPVILEEDDDEVEPIDEVSYFATLDTSTTLEMTLDHNLLHPAEIAAKFQNEHHEDSHVGGSDEQILKDLRKSVFSVPLLHQKDVDRHFNDLDRMVFPLVHKILSISDAYFAKVMQILIKVAAGNTYGKNIYEREGAPKTKCKNTYKEHEIKFLGDSYTYFRLFAVASSYKKSDKNYQNITKAMGHCDFIRGVYEELLHDFVADTKLYTDLHWLAVKAKQEQRTEDYHRFSTLIQDIDTKLGTDKSSFYVAREAASVYKKYVVSRAAIIAPYLRSVYSTAKSTSKNAHQMLDNFQNGTMGLVRAVSCYSIRRPASFASVAKWWIKQMMLLSIKEDANFVKLPISTWQTYTQLERIKNKTGLSDDDTAGIAKAAGISVKKVKSIYDTVKITQVYSLNKTYDSEEKLTLEDIVTNDDKLGSLPPGSDLSELLRDYCEVAELSAEEIKVLALRYGMIDIIPRTPVEEISVLKEATLQNLAAIGFHYKFA